MIAVDQSRCFESAPRRSYRRTRLSRRHGSIRRRARARRRVTESERVASDVDDRAENTRQSWRSVRKTTLILRRSLSMQITIKYIFCTNGSRTDDRVAFREISTFGRRTIKVNQERKTVGLFFSDPSWFSRRETPRRRRPIVSGWREGRRNR